MCFSSEAESLKTRALAILIALVLGLGLVAVAPARAEARASSGTDHAADGWSEAVIDILLVNKKVIARCIGNAVFLSYGALRALRAAALRDKISSIGSLAQGLAPASCVTTFEVASAALRIWRIGWLAGESFDVQDDSYVRVRPLLANECYFDVTVGDASGQTWNYSASYRICSKHTYGSYTY